MALRAGHGKGAGVPRIEVLPADELPLGAQAPEQATGRAERRPDGTFAPGARTEPERPLVGGSNAPGAPDGPDAARRRSGLRAVQARRRGLPAGSGHWRWRGRSARPLRPSTSKHHRLGSGDPHRRVAQRPAAAPRARRRRATTRGTSRRRRATGTTRRPRATCGRPRCSAAVSASHSPRFRRRCSGQSIT